ncbi:Fucose permease [Selenomonas ruminantium]|uniref:Fucose permease n=1 Tax=Selenomonas ruminantium TaxID=971 RepID=A0A1M6VF47_SELRU|nr:Fucose permease [Selenomonas ruminantium]
MSQDKDRLKAKERYAAGKMRQHSTRALFFIGGFGAASWAPLVPLLRERLAIGEDVLGMLLLCIGIGSLLTMPLSGAAAVRFGCRKTLTVAATVFALLLLVLCQVDNMVLAAVSLLVFGAMMGCIDVVINIQAVLVEKAAKRRLMSGMHALWSVGGFIGAGLFGIWVGTLGLTPLISTCIAVGIMLLTLAFFACHLLPFGGESGGAMVAIPRGIVAFVGVVACIAFLVEGAIMDWSGVFLTTVRNFDLSLAGTGFTVFSAAMLIMRLLGDVTVQRLGQKPVVVGGSLLALLGFLLVIFAPGSLLLYTGFFAIGIGSANIVPVFFSLLGKQKDMPISMAVPAVSTLGYLGILMGPAAIGFLAHQTSLYAAFGLLAALVASQAAIAAYVYKKVL